MVLISHGDKKIQEIVKQFGITKQKSYLTGALLALLYILVRIRKFLSWRESILAKYPSLPSTALLGNISQVVSAGGFTNELFEQLHNEKGKFAGIFLGPNVFDLSVLDPADVAELSQKAKSRPIETYNFLWYLGKENLMFQHGELVKQMRLRYGKMISDRSQLEKVHAKTVKAVNKMLEDNPVNQAFDLHKILGPLIYDIMGETMFDAPWLSTQRGRDIYECHKYLIVHTTRWMFWPFPPLFHPEYLTYVYTLYRWRQLINECIDERAELMKQDYNKYNNGAIALILTSKDEKTGRPFFSRARGISTLSGFLNGAYDTTHATTYWLFFHLAKYPEVQEKIVEEFHSVLGDEQYPTLDQLRECEYLHAFLQESMRFVATVPVNMRANIDEDITVGGNLIEKGTTVLIPLGVQSMQEEYFGPKPKEFRPERFLGNSPEAEKARKSWAVFGQHARMCIGFTFALVEMKCMLHTVLSQRIVRLENPNCDKKLLVEAGVYQPLVHENFVFQARLGEDSKGVHTPAEKSNLRWWLQQEQALSDYATAQQQKKGNFTV